MIVTVTLNPAVDKTARVDEFHVNGLNRLHNITKDAGGKGINVSKTIHQLQESSIVAGFVGGDRGEFIRQTLQELSIRECMITIDGQTRENLKVIDSLGNLTELNEEGPSLSFTDILELTTTILRLCQVGDIVVLSGSLPASLSKDVYARMIQVFKKHQLRVILDADGESFALAIKEGPSAIKPNLYEVSKYFGVSEELVEKDLLGYAKRFLQFGIELVVISLGKDGAVFVSSTQIIKSKGLRVNAKSSVGAGDAMVAAIAIGLQRKLSLEEIATLAVAASAGAVLSEGTNPASLEVVEQLKKQVTLEQWRYHDENKGG